MQNPEPAPMSKSEIELREEFRTLSDQILGSFPEIELRLSRMEGSDVVSLAAPEHGTSEIELSLNQTPSELLHEAVFAVKALARIFDA